MQEGDVQLLCALARLLVDETNALLADLSQCVGYAVLYAECDVVYTLVALVQPLLNGALRRCWLQQFQLHLTAAQEGSLHSVKYGRLSSILWTAMPRCSMCEIFISLLISCTINGCKDTKKIKD